MTDLLPALIDEADATVPGMAPTRMAPFRGITPAWPRGAVAHDLYNGGQIQSMKRLAEA